MRELRMHGGEEDALTGARRLYGWAPGMVAYWKRHYNKRVRRAWKKETR